MMKITKRQLKRIIREEKAKLFNEARIEVDMVSDDPYADLEHLPPGLSGKVLTNQGPAGGHPVVLVQGNRKALEDWYVNVYSGGDQYAVGDFHEFVQESKLAEGMPDLRDSGGPMLDLGAAIEDAIAKAQIATGSSKGYQKELASEIQLELEGLLEMMWEL